MSCLGLNLGKTICHCQGFGHTAGTFASTMKTLNVLFVQVLPVIMNHGSAIIEPLLELCKLHISF